jgi:hypothetical protein
MTHSEPLDVSVLLKPAKEFILPGNAKWPLVSPQSLFFNSFEESYQLLIVTLRAEREYIYNP